MLSENELALVVTAIVAVMGVLVAFGTKAFAMYAGMLKEKVKHDELKALIDRVQNTATIVVQSLNQTMVDDLKAAAEDGKLTQEEKTRIKDSALMSLLNTLNDQGKELLKETFGDLNEYLTKLIESKVGEAKKGLNKPQ